jgi:serine-type D-Ala-D-Ala carboxypeptidase (penicillin-binding protein 5/6)
MKAKVLLYFICFGIYSAGYLQAKPLSCSVSAESAILMNADTGKILFEKNAHVPRYPASITKIATGLYTIKFFPHLMNQHVSCSQEALKCLTEAEKSKGNYSKYPSYILETDMSHMGLKVGEEMSFRDLLLGTMIVSGDDASNVIAETAGEGSIERFLQGMNEYLASLGLKNTRFLNPHGLHHPEHVSTAYDIALLTREALNDPHYMEIVKMSRFHRPQTNKQDPVTLQQTNKLIVKTSPQYYPYATSGKTGYHRRARHNLAATAEKDGRRLIAVVLSCEKRPNIFQDAKTLFQTAFQEEKRLRTILPDGPQKFQREVTGGITSASTYTQEPLAITYYPSEEPALRCQLVWHNVAAPLKRGDNLGELHLLADDVTVSKVALLSSVDVEMSYSYYLKQKFAAVGSKPFLVIAIAGFILFALYFLLFRR